MLALQVSFHDYFLSLTYFVGMALVMWLIGGLVTFAGTLYVSLRVGSASFLQLLHRAWLYAADFRRRTSVPGRRFP